MKWLELYAITIVHLGTIPAVGYPLLWRLRGGDWHKSRVGRALMRKAEALAVLFVVSIVNVWVPGAWFVWVYCAALTWVVWTLTRQFVVLLSVLREREAKP